MAKTIVKAQLPAALVKTKVEGTKMLTPLEKEVRGLEVHTPEQYQEADSLLVGIIHARQEWKLKVYGSPAKPGPITLQRQALEALYQMNRDIDGPLESMEKEVRKHMAGYKAEEQRQLQEAERERQRRDDEARRALEAAAEREANAKTAAARAKAATQRVQAESKVEEIEAEETPAPVEAQSTSSRTVKRWRIKDLVAIVAAVADGNLDLETLTVDISYVNQFKPDDIGKWPGFEVYEETQIVRRRP